MNKSIFLEERITIEEKEVAIMTCTISNGQMGINSYLQIIDQQLYLQNQELVQQKNSEFMNKTSGLAFTFNWELLD